MAMGQKFNTNDFLYDQQTTPFEVPIEIHVGMLGFRGDGAHAIELSAEGFQKDLEHTLPSRTPACVETGKELSVQYTISYRVQHLQTSDLRLLEEHLKRSLKPAAMGSPTARHKEIPVYDVEISEMESIFDTIYSHYTDDPYHTVNFQPATGKVPNSIIFLNLDKARFTPQGATGDRFIYRYRYHGGGYTQNWIAKNRYLIVDVSAGPVQFGNLNAGEGTVSETSIPNLYRILENYRSHHPEGNIKPQHWTKTHWFTEFRAQLSSLVVSAVRHIFVPDVRYASIEFPDKILIPIIALRNHNSYDPFKPSADDPTRPYIDLDLIKEEIQKTLLPNQQELFLVSGSHSLHEHKHISLVVSQSMVADTVHEVGTHGRYIAKMKPYIDSALLAQRLRDSSDQLTNDFIQHKTIPQSIASAFGIGLNLNQGDELIDELRLGSGSDTKPLSLSHGTRILPVYVLSFDSKEERYMMDQKDLVAVYPDMLLAVQTLAQPMPVAMFSELESMVQDPKSLTRHIIAGVASALGGLLQPTERFSATHGRVINDYIWANGHHPFGVFSKTPHLSQIFIDSILRNSIVSRLNSALRVTRHAIDKIDAFSTSFIFDPLSGSDPSNVGWISKIYFGSVETNPFGVKTVTRLHSEIRKLEQEFVAAAKNLYHLDFHRAYVLSDSVFISAEAFHKYVLGSLREAQSVMDCCVTRHVVEHGSNFNAFALLAGLGFSVFFVLMWLTTPAKTGRRQ
eukprot:GILJ01009525.1.p1 GENE.GILJ01009525.1~~GILJ01009525.1.p1  ORF type:complete len:770 (+),score=115.28 GILJ01009525.1:103-2310(+)